MQRRNFFRNSALYAGTALAAAQNFSFAAGEFSGVLKKGIKFSMLREPELAIADRFRLLKDLGFDGVELSATDCDRLSEFRQAAEQTNVKIYGVVNPPNSDLAAAIQFAGDLGAEHVSFIPRYHKNQPLIDSWEQSQSAIKEAISTSESCGVKILVENARASFLGSAFDVQRYIDEIGPANVGSYFDVGTSAQLGVPEHWVELLGGKIGSLRIKDWDDRLHKTEGLRSALKSDLGDGTVDWSKVRAALKQAEYFGWATAAVLGGDRMRLLDISQRMDRVLGLI